MAELFQQGARARLTLGRNQQVLFFEIQFAPVAGAALAQLPLDSVQTVDMHQGGLGVQWGQVTNFVELPSSMGPATDLDNPSVGFQEDLVVEVGGVGLKEALVTLQESRRAVARVVGGVVENRQRMIVSFR